MILVWAKKECLSWFEFGDEERRRKKKIHIGRRVNARYSLLKKKGFSCTTLNLSRSFLDQKK